MRLRTQLHLRGHPVDLGFSGSLFLLFVRELVLVESQLLQVLLPRLAAAADVDAALVVLHLLLRFKSLLAFNRGAFELVAARNGQIVSLDLRRRLECRVPHLGGLHQALDPTLVPEVRAPDFLALLREKAAFRGRAVHVRVREADKEHPRGKAGPLEGRALAQAAHSGREVEQRFL